MWLLRFYQDWEIQGKWISNGIIQLKINTYNQQFLNLIFILLRLSYSVKFEFICEEWWDRVSAEWACLKLLVMKTIMDVDR